MRAIVGASNQITQMAMVFSKPVKTINIHNFNYPTLDAQKLGNPKSLISQDFCNDSPEIQDNSVKVTTAVGHSVEWTSSASFSFEESVTISAGVPEIVKVEDKASWKVSAEASHTKKEDTEDTTEQTFDFPTPAMSRLKATVIQWQGTLNIPYTATSDLTFTDGTKFSKTISGSFNGVTVSQAATQTDVTKLTKGEKCGGENSTSETSFLQ